MFFRFFLWVGLVLAVTGCASALDKKAESVDLSKESIVVFSLDLVNEFKPGFPASSLTGLISKLEKPGSAERTGLGPFNPTAIDPVSKIAVISKKLAPGRYTIGRIQGLITQFIFRAQLDFAVNAPFEVVPNSVIYLGHLSLVNKEIKDRDDQASGFAVPLIDQLVSGMSQGTLRVKLEDRYDSTVKQLKEDYRSLRNLDIVRAPLASITLERSTGSKAAPVEVALSQP